MRFVSKSAHFSAGNFRNAEEAIGDPKTVVIEGKTRTIESQSYEVRPAVPFQFSQKGLLQTDIDAGLSHWKHFPGLPVEEDRITPANPVEYGRIGVLDTVQWQKEYGLTDEERERGEQMLLSSRWLGIEYILIEEVKAEKPWPSYDKTHHNKIPSLATELGLLSEALAYEKENGNRPSVVEALEAALETEAGEIVAA